MTLEVQRGDSVYFRNGKAITKGSVVCHGKHGVTLDDDAGCRHQVVWDHLVGHHKRAQLAMRVVDEGEDGAVLEDEHGDHHFIEHGDAGDDDMKKAHQPRMLIFLKGGPVANRPGLSLQTTSDKAGHQTRRWKKTGVEQKGPERGKYHHDNLDVGHKVHFSTEDGRHGSGEVHAKGKDGVTAKDDSGAEHQVHYHEITGHEARSGVAGVIPAGVNDSLPKDANQPTGDLGKLMKQAKETLPKFREMSANLAEKLDGAPVFDVPESEENFEKFKNYLESGTKGFAVLIGPLKKEERIRKKALEDHLARGGSPEGASGIKYHGIKDIVRGTVVCDTVDEVGPAFEALMAQGWKASRKIKDRFANPTNEGYRDLLVNLTSPDGHIVEMQVNTKAMLKAKEVGHKYYDKQRKLELSIMNAGRDASEEEAAILNQLNQAQVSVYSRGWKESSVKQMMAKSRLFMFFGGMLKAITGKQDDEMNEQPSVAYIDVDGILVRKTGGHHEVWRDGKWQSFGYLDKVREEGMVISEAEAKKMMGAAGDGESGDGDDAKGDAE